MNWESSIEYYRLVNETVKARLGGLHSTRSLMVSVDFEQEPGKHIPGDRIGRQRVVTQA
jgi:aspartate/glutamate racemase